MRGVLDAVGAACAGGGLAIGQSEPIASRKQDRMIAGGVQEISWESMCSFDALGAFSKCEGAPDKASWPFAINQETDWCQAEERPSLSGEDGSGRGQGWGCLPNRPLWRHACRPVLHATASSTASKRLR